MNLSYVARQEIERLLALEADEFTRGRLFADLCRINALYMIMRAGSGHIGSSFSSLDIVSRVYLEELHEGDVYFSSKGHDAPGLYAVLLARGVLADALIHTLRECDGLPGHPDVNTPGIAANTGSLGMGISKAKGMIEAWRRQRAPRHAYVMTGDGELQEGQVWESLQGAANRGLAELTVVVDHNKIQSDTWVRSVSDLGDLERKFAAFEWAVYRCDGHDHRELGRALRAARTDDRPSIVIADTVKGRGVSFMETGMDAKEMYRFHSGAPTEDVYAKALDELVSRVNSVVGQLAGGSLELVSVEVPDRGVPHGQRMVIAYSEALCEQAQKDDRIVALDGDLVLDTGLVPFVERFPDRFIECGIAEQDMVSQAGGLALAGMLPVVHSFASFLSTRPNEQIFVNATEGTKIIYVGSLAGVIPAGPGHSHQSVRDVGVLGSVPGLVVAEPCHEEEVALLIDVCLRATPGSSYLRLVTPPVDIPYEYPKNSHIDTGRGVVLRPGSDIAFVGAGPVVLSEAYRAAEALKDHGRQAAVVDLPWHNVVDLDWLHEVTEDVRLLLFVDNHVSHGSQGQLALAEIAKDERSWPKRAHVAVRGIPLCGRNDEVLSRHGLDASGLCNAALEHLAE